MIWFREIVQIGSESAKKKNSTQEISRVRESETNSMPSQVE